jgi:ubiquinone/menaquinone biosynthesis C-methylase UbiE
MDLTRLRELYEQKVNVIEYLEKKGSDRTTSVEISYDLQAGSYIQDSRDRPELFSNYNREIAETIKSLGVTVSSLMEAGVGEATTLSGVLRNLKPPPVCLGFDISWSRVKYAETHLNEQFGKLRPFKLFLGDLFSIPLPDNSVDIVYTSHSVEPNGGREEEALIELYRVARKYLILCEPSFELATGEGRARMLRLGYVRGLSDAAKKLGLKVVDYRLMSIIDNALNPTARLIIEKNPGAAENSFPGYACPFSRLPLKEMNGCYWSPGALRIFPIVGNIPCLSKKHGLIATHFEDFFAPV